MTEGERWVRDALVDLRAAGYAPGAVGSFLAASQRRANETRADRPGLARQARAWTALGALAWILPALAGRGWRGGLCWWGFCALMLDWHLGMVESERGEPRALGPADALTLARAWLVPLAADRAGPLVCAVGLASDALDGPLARRAVPTRAGRDLEGAVDAAFAAAALRGAVRGGGLGRPAAALEAGRLACGVAFSCASWFGAARPPDPALARAARATTPIRALGLMAASLRRRRVAGVLVGAGALAGAASYARPTTGARSTSARA